ncbi:MAG: TRAP transporter large permease subunit [Burkholderiaceae bacterium]|nr:TRAP transporter large permease subunit [Burkholderiaceae bacterium]
MKIRRELWFGVSLMAAIVLAVLLLTPWGNLTNGHLGLIMLALIVVAIMLGFPTAFTLMGMGVIFAWLAYRSVNPDLAVRQVLDLMVQRTYGVMSNDVLIAIPLFVFMGYLVERAALIERLFKSLHLALARVPGSLAVATIATCALFATATGIVGAVVTLMGLLALPAMLRAGYDVKISAGSITAGGCLGILIPPSVLLIVYGATAGVSVVQLYAGAFFPGFMLAGLYVLYVVLMAKWRPQSMPPLPEEERRVPLSAAAQALAQRGRHALVALARAFGGAAGLSAGAIARQWAIALLPAVAIVGVLFLMHRAATAPVVQIETAGVIAAGGAVAADIDEADNTASTGVGAPPAADDAPQEAGAPREETTPAAGATQPQADAAADQAAAQRRPTPTWYWVTLAIGLTLLALIYATWTWERVEVFKMLLTSFFPLAILIVSVLGSIVFGLATPTEAAAVGAFGSVLLAAAYRYAEHRRTQAAPLGKTVRELGTILKESSFLTAKTSAMVCWLFVGSAIFSAAFALLGGQEIVERWVLSLELTPVQFLILSQIIIFLLGWPLEWTEIIVIFMPIFIPLLAHFNIDPLFFGLLVALNLQTAFLSPPVAMSAFYLKGVAPPQVTLNQIFAGMLPFMGIQIIAIVLLYLFPQIGLWLPSVLYGN